MYKNKKNFEKQNFCVAEPNGLRHVSEAEPQPHAQLEHKGSNLGNKIPLINPNDEPTTLMGFALNSKEHKKNFAKSKIFVPNKKNSHSEFLCPISQPEKFALQIFGPIEPKGSIGKADSGQKLIVSDSGNKIPEIPYPYKAVMCPHCGRIQVTTGEVCFRCRICSKTSSYSRNGRSHVKFKDFPTHEMACIFAKRWSESIAK